MKVGPNPGQIEFNPTRSHNKNMTSQIKQISGNRPNNVEENGFIIQIEKQRHNSEQLIQESATLVQKKLYNSKNYTEQMVVIVMGRPIEWL